MERLSSSWYSPSGSQGPLKIPALFPCREEDSIGREILVLQEEKSLYLELSAVEQKTDDNLVGI